ncbi:MAG TPA: S8 family peptidase [Niabella sp.]|nr:S8 family peptidase [Niabella sp.]
MPNLWLVSLIFVFYGCKKSDKFIRNNNEIPINITVPIGATKFNEYVPNEIIVKFKKGISEAGKSSFLKTIQAEPYSTFRTEVIENIGEDGEYVIARIKGDPMDLVKYRSSEIEYMEPNYIYHTLETSNDPFFLDGTQWNLMNSPYGTNVANAWANGNTGSSNVYIAVLDEGYMYNHEDLIKNAGVNTKEIPGNGIDDDKNGYVDDVYGWDFYNGDNTIYDENQDNHGTHVAGIIGAEGGNGKGVSGIAWNVKLISGKFMGPTGGYTPKAVEAIEYFIKLKQKGMNIVAINASWGNYNYSEILKEAIEKANNAGILFIAAAGNNSNNNDDKPLYPASYNLPNVISVANLSSSGMLSAASNYGKKTVHLAAPGSGIMSTIPNNGYGIKDGTSMAAPHFAGAVALYASIYPNDNIKMIKMAILNSVMPMPSLKDKCITGGRLNLTKFFKTTGPFNPFFNY